METFVGVYGFFDVSVWLKGKVVTRDVGRSIQTKQVRHVEFDWAARLPFCRCSSIHRRQRYGFKRR